MSEIEQGYLERTVRRKGEDDLNYLIERFGIERKTADIKPKEKEPVGALESFRSAIKEHPATAVAGGEMDAIRETANVPTDIINLFKDKEMQGLGDFLPQIPKSELASNQVLRSGAQFLTTFVPLFGSMKGLGAVPKVGKILQAELAGSVGAASAFDPDEPRLSNLINDLAPPLKNVFTEFLATSPDDSDALGRAKNALEGLGMGALTNGILGALRAMRAAKGMTKQAGKVKEEISGTGEGVFGIKTPEDFGLKAKELAEIERRRFEAKRGKRGKDVTLDAAEQSELKNIKNILDIEEGTALNAEDIIAVGRVVTNTFDNMKSIGNQIKEELAKDNYPAELIAKYTDELNTFLAIDPKFFGVRGEAGRALQAHSIISDDIGRLKRLGEQVAGIDENTTIEQLINMVDSIKSPKELSKFMKRLKAMPGAITEAWLAGLLTSPKTHFVNILGNTSNVFFHIPERFVASLIPGSQISTSEAAYSVFGMLHAFSRALRVAGRTALTGEPSEAILRSNKLEGFKKRITAEAFELDKTGVAGKAVDYLGEFVRLPFRGLMSADDFFKTINQEAELFALARRTVDQQGLKGQAAHKKMWEIINDPPPDIAQKAADFSAYQTFTNDLGRFGQNIQHFANTHTWAKFVLPFVRTPINIFKYSYERTPLKLPFAIWKKVVKGGGPEADLALARASLGSMAMATFAMYAASGYYTGRGPKNATLRKMKMDTGWRPYSIKVGNDYISYNRLDPVGMMMGMVADFVEGSQYMDYHQLEELAVGIVMAFEKNFISKTYVTGLRNAMDMLNVGEGPEGVGKGIRAGGKFIASFVPTILRDIEKATDPQLRRLEGEGIAMRWWNGVMAEIPYFSSSVPVERNVFGEEVLLETGFTSIFNPFYISHQKEDKEMEALIENEVIVDNIPKWIYGKAPSLFGHPRPDDAVKLTTEQHDRYKVLAGMGLRDKIRNIISSRTYLMAVPGRLGKRHMMLFNAIQQNRDMARDMLLAEYPDLLNKVQNKIIRLEAAKEGFEDLIPEALRR